MLTTCTFAWAQEGISVPKKTQDQKTAYQQIQHLNELIKEAKEDLQIVLLKNINEKERTQNTWIWMTITISVVSAVIIFTVVRNLQKRRREFEAEKKLKD